MLGIFQLAVRHTSERSSCVYICLCFTVTWTTWTRVCVAWKLLLNSPLYGAAIWGLLSALFRKQKNRLQSAVYIHVVVCSSCCSCVVCVDCTVFWKKNGPFSRWFACCGSCEWTCGRFWFRKRCIGKGIYSPRYGSVAYRGGVWGVQTPPPPEITKFWQSCIWLQIERKMFSVPIPTS